MKIVDFYRGEIPNNDGYKIDQILSWGPDQWEACHSFIQWLFPTKTKSNFNPDAPVLTDDEIVLFRTDLFLASKFEDVFYKMLDVYGIDYITEDDTLKWKEGTDRDVTWWLKTFNHNALRMTRILECLNHFGRPDWAKVLYHFLVDFRPVSDNTKDFWRNAAFPGETDK